MNENGDRNTNRDPGEENDLDMEDVKIKTDVLSSNISEASTLLLDNYSDNEKFNSSKKRKNKTPQLVLTFPKHFTNTQIKKCLEELCEPYELKILQDSEDNRTVKASFRSLQDMHKVKKMVENQATDDININATIIDSDSDMDSQDEGPQAKRKKESVDTPSPWGLDMDVWRTDPKGWYGVKPQYLTTLGINDPLQNWVLVINFRCGKDELKEVMELAGDVLVCTVHSQRSCRYANVMYRHPLEALQAVSMFNGQTFYGKPLTVKILKCNGVVLPKGLDNIGPGLAKYGKPLRDVVRHYERYIKGQENGLNINLFRTPQEQLSNDDEVLTEIDDSKRKAKNAIETLVAEGVDLKDLVLALKEVIAAQKDNSLDPLITEFLNASDAEHDESDSFTNKRTRPTEGDQIVSRDENENFQSISTIANRSSSQNSSEPINKSRSESPDSARNSSVSSVNAQDSKKIRRSSTISLSRSAESLHGSRSHTIRSTPSPSSVTTSSYRPSNQIRPVGPIVGPSYQPGFAGPRHMGPGPIQGQPCGPVRPIGPSGPVGPALLGSHAMAGPRAQMYGPNVLTPGPSGPMPSGPMFGPIGPLPGPRPISGPMSGPMAGPMSGPISGPLSRTTCPSGSMSGPMSGPAGPMNGPNFSMPGPNTHPPFGPTVHPTSGPEATLQFSNLPPSTTFALLSDKLSQVGQLISIQFTVPGCVVVKYAHRSHAERCMLKTLTYRGKLRYAAASFSTARHIDINENNNSTKHDWKVI